MVDFYCDHGAYGLTTNRLGLDAPSWGVPQEGDGSSIDASTASSVAAVDLTSITSTAGTFSLFGSSAISVGASASGATLATQIAAAINVSTTVTGNTTIFPGAPQLRNAFFARATGAVLEIMCRIGSTLTNVLGMTWAGTWSAGPPSNLTFSGGSGGCWGWFFNSVAIGVSSSYGIGNYGAMLKKPVVGLIPTVNDTIWCRSGGGASKHIYIDAQANIAPSHDAFSNNVVIDTNTKWTSDSDVGSIYFHVSGWNNRYVQFTFTGGIGYSTSIVALRRGGLVISHEWQTNANYASSCEFRGAAGAFYAKNWLMKEDRFAYAFLLKPSLSGNTISNTTCISWWEDCDYVVTAAGTSAPSLWIQGAYNQSNNQNNHIGCTFDLNISGVSFPGDLYSYNTSYPFDAYLNLINCKFLGYSPGFRLLSSAGSYLGGSRLEFNIEHCSGLEMPNLYTGFPNSTRFNYQGYHKVAHMQITDANTPGMRIEDTRGVAEWLPSLGFPVLASVNQNGSLWSIRLVWVKDANLSVGYPYESPPLRMSTQLTSGVRTFELNLMVPSWVTTQVLVRFSYVSDTGEPSNLVSSTLTTGAAWTGASAWPALVSKKVSVTTPVAVRANNEIICRVFLVASPIATLEYIFIDPEFTVT